jgi:hypothetical protein
MPQKNEVVFNKKKKKKKKKEEEERWTHWVKRDSREDTGKEGVLTCWRGGSPRGEDTGKVRPNKAKRVAGNHWEVFGFAHRGSRRAVGAKLLVQASSEVTGDGKDKLPAKLLACANRGCRPSRLSQGKAEGRQPSGFSLLLSIFVYN